MEIYEKLAKLIGNSFSYLNCNWLLIEILPEQDSLVLRRLDSQKRVQANQYGSANRFCNETLTIKISDLEEEGYSDEIKILLTGIIK